MIHLTLASHGNLSKGMLESVAMIAGQEAVANIATYCLQPGENPNDYVALIKSDIASSNDTYVFICDIKGGSVYNAVVSICDLPNVVILSGMNMNMVLAFVLAYGQGDKEVDYAQILEESTGGIGLMKSSTVHQNIIEEEF